MRLLKDTRMLRPYVIIIMFFLLTSLLSVQTWAQDSKGDVTICTEDSQWYPYTFQAKGKIEGSLVELTHRALANAGFAHRIVMMPWRRCLLDVKLGNMDGAIGASFSAERAEYMHYPSDAAAAKFENRAAKWRLEYVEYVALSMKAEKFDYDGDLLALPQPVYLPQGFSLVEELIEEGVVVDTRNRRDLENVDRLLMRKNGSVVLVRPLANYAMGRETYANELSISDHPVVSKSVFLGFSKKGQLTADQRESVWMQLELASENKNEILTEILKLSPDDMKN